MEYKEDARLDEDGQVETAGFRQLLLDEAAEDADTEVANVETERMLWLLKRVNALVEVFVLVMEFRQLLDADELETLLAAGLPLRVLIGDVPRHGCGECD